MSWQLSVSFCEPSGSPSHVSKRVEVLSQILLRPSQCCACIPECALRSPQRLEGATASHKMAVCCSLPDSGPSALGEGPAQGIQDSSCPREGKCPTRAFLTAQGLPLLHCGSSRLGPGCKLLAQSLSKGKFGVYFPNAQFLSEGF